MDDKNRTITIPVNEYKYLVTADAMLQVILHGREFDRKAISEAVEKYLYSGEVAE